jgi:hypothetical protein
VLLTLLVALLGFGVGTGGDAAGPPWISAPPPHARVPVDGPLQRVVAGRPVQEADPERLRVAGRTGPQPLGGVGVKALVAGVRCLFAVKDAGRLNTQRYWRDCLTRADAGASSAALRHNVFCARPS